MICLAKRFARVEDRFHKIYTALHRGEKSTAVPLLKSQIEESRTLAPEISVAAWPRDRRERTTEVLSGHLEWAEQALSQIQDGEGLIQGT